VLPHEAGRDHRGSGSGERPAPLDRWRRWTTLPAVANDRLLIVDADLLPLRARFLRASSACAGD
jgi:hypothetical protein